MPNDGRAPGNGEQTDNTHTTRAAGSAERGRTVLLGFQDSDTARVLVDAFSFRGMSGVHAASGAAVLASIQQTQPELVVLDLAQPDTDGLVLCADVRARTPAPIIVCGSGEDRREALLAFRLGADDFVGKPFDVDDVLARAEVALRRGTVTAAPVSRSSAPAVQVPARVVAGGAGGGGAGTPTASRLERGSPGERLVPPAERVPVLRDVSWPVAPASRLRKEAAAPQRAESAETQWSPARLEPPERPERQERRQLDNGQARVTRAGALELDHIHHRVAVAGREVRLSRSEFLLLGALMERADELLSRLELARAVWGEQLASVGRPIDQHMYRLRTKLQQAARAGGVPAPAIVSVPGFGYRLVAEGALQAAS